jgi:hypothetical protein
LNRRRFDEDEQELQQEGDNDEILDPDRKLTKKEIAKM